MGNAPGPAIFLEVGSLDDPAGSRPLYERPIHHEHRSAEEIPGRRLRESNPLLGSRRLRRLLPSRRTGRRNAETGRALVFWNHSRSSRNDGKSASTRHLAILSEVLRQLHEENDLCTSSSYEVRGRISLIERPDITPPFRTYTASTLPDETPPPACEPSSHQAAEN